MPEEWKPVPGFEDEYAVSDSGRLWSYHTDDFLTPYLNPARDRSGLEYFRVDLRKDGDRRQVYVHHLVLEAFEGKRPNGAHAHHVDGNQHNNSRENLEWVNEEDHMDHHNGTAEDEEAPRAKEAPF